MKRLCGWACLPVVAAALLLSGCRCAAGRAATGVPSGFVHLAEAVPEVILEPRYYSTYNFVGDRIDGYERPAMLLTVEAAAALTALDVLLCDGMF